MEPTQAITKRLSFGEVSQVLNATQPLDVDDVIKALRNPSVENYQAALGLLEKGYQQRFEIIQATSKEQSSSVGDADLRRLKRQFSSLKNTFLHYEVKDEFIAAVADGLPNGTEEIQLAQFEEEVVRNVTTLRALKAQNEETTGAISELITQIVEVLGGLGKTREAADSALERLQQELEQAEREVAAMPPPLGDGPDEAECQEALAAAAAETRELEARIAAELAEAAELEGALASEREDAELARAEAAELRAQSEEQDQALSTQTRFAQTEAWVEEATSLLSSLGGVALLSSSPSELVLQLTTAYPTAAVAAGSMSACAQGSHRLTLRLHPASGAVRAAELDPPEVDLGDVMEAAQAGARGADFAVRETRSRLAGFLHRRALAAEARARFPGAAADPSMTRVKALVGPPGGCVEVEVRLVQWWPCGDDVAAVEADGLRLEVRGFAAALEAASRKLATKPEAL